MRARKRSLVLALFMVLATPATLRAQESGRLLGTAGVSQVEGASGGGLVPWATIAGYGTRDAVGAQAHYTLDSMPDFTLQSTGVAIGFYDRLELSYTHAWFDTGSTGTRLGLGKDFQFQLDVVGAKLRLLGDLVYDQDRWLPQIAIGTQYKVADHADILRAIGARSADGADFYISATKLLLGQSLLLDATVRATKANQFGFLGFGGDRNQSYSAQFEGSAGLLLRRDLVVGAEIRTKPDNLGFAHEGTAYDVFFAYFFNKNIAATVAFTALGPIANQGNQNGFYFSLTGGF
ncbi:MAG TPA: DUF3034 family protein [Rhodopila sp.]|nr:DUF3034 family protein [Rhodopila sp.]